METNTMEKPPEQTERIDDDAKVEKDLRCTIKSDIEKLSLPLLSSLQEYVTFLVEKEKKHQAFVKRILEIEANSDAITFDSVDEAMEAIRNWSE